MAAEGTKTYFKISEVEEFLGENSSTLRYWEKEFPKLIKPMRGSRDVRFYTNKDIENLKIVKYLLRDKGLRIESARSQLEKNFKNISTRVEALGELKILKEELSGILKSLDKRR